jgi:antitoxin component HigA of HigAB toxin-antitoxin module
MANRKIETDRDYNATMKKIDALMKKGEDNLTSNDADKLRALALAAQAFEKRIYTTRISKSGSSTARH